MSRSIACSRLLRPALAGILLAGFAVAGAWGEDNVINRPATSAPDTLKKGRVTVDGIAKTIFENGNVQPLEPSDADKASGGLTLLERMGATLPPLPAEKPNASPADEAYGAYQRGLFLTAMDKALPRAEKGDAAAQTLIGELLSNGLGVKRDEKEAAFWYAQAAENGDANAMLKYAVLLMEGRGVKQDKAKADAWMKKSADAGNGSAAFNHAQVVVGEHPGKEGLKLALPYYEKAAAQGIADGQYAASQIYMGLPELGADHKQKALYWVERAAQAGYDTARLDLGLWLVNGTAGERKSEEGFKWLKRAADQGNISAANKVAHLLINAIGTRPDPVEAAKWYVISRRAGLVDEELEDFFLGINDDQQKKAIELADAFRPHG